MRRCEMFNLLLAYDPTCSAGITRSEVLRGVLNGACIFLVLCGVWACLLIYRRWYRKSHMAFTIVDYVDGEFKARPTQVVEWPPKWYQKFRK
jgi:hypothetical protein